MRERALRIIRFVDWRFILVFTLMIMAMTVYYLVDTSSKQRDEAIELLSHQNRVSAEERKEARIEREIILKQLNELQDKYDVSVKINRDFVAWLRSQGYRVPDEYILAENVRLETSDEREARQRREAQQNQERKRSGGGTNNSGPDNPSEDSDGGGGDRGDDNGRGGDRDGDGDKDRGKSDGKSHGDNAGGQGRGRN